MTNDHHHAQENPPIPASNSLLDGFDASLFKQASRLHVLGHALFTHDHHLVINPEEVTPENEPQLISKVLRHFSAQQPSFFESGPTARSTVVDMLAQLAPVSLAARKATLKHQSDALDKEEKQRTAVQSDSGHDADQSPMSQYVHRGARTDDDLAPDLKEKLANGLACYLLLQEALYQKGYRHELAAYLHQMPHAARAMDLITSALNISSDQVSSTLQQQGIAGLASLLHIPDATRNTIAQLVAQATENGFAANPIENWVAGHHIDGLQDQPIAEVIETGKLARTSHTIESARRVLATPQLQGATHDIIEDRLVAILRDMPPALQKALFLSGTEISATPSHQIGDLVGFQHTALGQYWFLPMTRGANDGVRQIYLTAANNTEHISKVLQHEAHHLFFPANFTAQDLKAMDRLLGESSAHLRELNALCQAWLAGTAEERKSVADEISDRFGAKGITLDNALGGQFNEDAMHRLVRAADLASRDLDVHGSDLKLFYTSPESRAAEMVSRFAAIKYVTLRDAPAMLHFIAPQMEALYQRHYLPHLERAVAQMEQATEPPQASPSAPRMVALASRMSAPHDNAPTPTIDAATATPDRAAAAHTPALADEQLAALHDMGFADRLAAGAMPHQHTAISR